MNKSIILGTLFVSALGFAQVIIGTGKTGLTNTSVSLEFGTEKKGILLPTVDSDAAVTGAVAGTIIFDAAKKKAEVKLTSSWKDLTIDTNGKTDTVPAFVSESATAKTSIGTPSSIPGILVLEDANKAMILPTVSVYTDIPSPSAGMMVYLSKDNQLAFFNGTVWTFWKP